MKRAAAILVLTLMAGLAATSLLLHPGRRLADSYSPPTELLPDVTLAHMTTAEGDRLVVTSTRSSRGVPGGLAVGDRIEDVDGQPAPTLTALRADLDHDRSPTLRLHVRRGDRLLMLVVARPT